MMKSWADHCSSDEESVDDLGDEELENQQSVDQKEHDDDEEHGDDFEIPAKTYDFPTGPPFTAFVGNLAFTVKEPDQLQAAIHDAVADRFGEQITMVGGRIGMDRRDGNKHRGFGYVEVETLEHVRTVLLLLLLGFSECMWLILLDSSLNFTVETCHEIGRWTN
jgi:hypothetical protein